MQKAFRQKLGIALFAIGNLSVVAGLLLPLVGGADSGSIRLSAVLLGAGEVLSLTSIAFIGREGFIALKERMARVFRASYSGPVSQRRHHVGVALFLFHAASTYFIVLYAYIAITVAGIDTSADSAVFGLGIHEQGRLLLFLFIAGEVSLLLSIYVLGADWWERFRQLFVWSGQPRNSQNS